MRAPRETSDSTLLNMTELIETVVYRPSEPVDSYDGLRVERVTVTARKAGRLGHWDASLNTELHTHARQSPTAMRTMTTTTVYP